VPQIIQRIKKVMILFFIVILVTAGALWFKNRDFKN